jgi:hypothetical protein
LGTILLASCNGIVSTTPKEGLGFDDKTSNSLGLQYNLPRADILLRGKYVTKLAPDGITEVGKTYEVTISAKRFADMSAPVFAKITTNAMFQENTHLKVERSMLQMVSTSPQDKTGDVIVALAKTAIAGAKVMANLPAATPFNASPEIGAPVEKLVKEFQEKLNPGSLEDFNRLKGKLEECGFDLDIPDIDPIRTELGKKKGIPTPSNGLVYRMRLPVFISLVKKAEFKYQAGTVAETKFENSVEIPHPGAIGVLPMKRVFMAQRKTTINFVDGDPFEISMEQDSPVMNFVSVPLKIAEAAADAIPGIIQVHNKAPKDNISAQADYLDAQARLIESQKKLQDAQNAVPATP